MPSQSSSLSMLLTAPVGGDQRADNLVVCAAPTDSHHHRGSVGHLTQTGVANVTLVVINDEFSAGRCLQKESWKSYCCTALRPRDHSSNSIVGSVVSTPNSRVCPLTLTIPTGSVVDVWSLVVTVYVRRHRVVITVVVHQSIGPCSARRDTWRHLLLHPGVPTCSRGRRWPRQLRSSCSLSALSAGSAEPGEASNAASRSSPIRSIVL